MTVVGIPHDCQGSWNLGLHAVNVIRERLDASRAHARRNEHSEMLTSLRVECVGWLLVDISALHLRADVP